MRCASKPSPRVRGERNGNDNLQGQDGDCILYGQARNDRLDGVMAGFWVRYPTFEASRARRAQPGARRLDRRVMPHSLPPAMLASTHTRRFPWDTLRFEASKHHDETPTYGQRNYSLHRVCGGMPDYRFLPAPSVNSSKVTRLEQHLPSDVLHVRKWYLLLVDLWSYAWRWPANCCKRSYFYALGLCSLPEDSRSKARPKAAFLSALRSVPVCGLYVATRSAYPAS